MKPILSHLSLLATVMLASSMCFAQGNTRLVREYNDTLTNVKSLKIDGQFSKVEVVGSTDNQLIVSGKLMSDKQDDAYQIIPENNNGDLSLSIRFPTQGWTSHSGEILIRLPEGLKLDIITTSGTIKLADVKNCDATVNSRTGNIEIANLSGNIRTSTVTAITRISNIKGNINTASKAGAQYIQDVTGEVNSSSTEGELRLTKVEGRVKTESTSGNQTMLQIQGPIVGKAVNGNIKISESSGEVVMVTFAGTMNIHNYKGVLNLQSTIGEQVGSRVTLTGSSSFKTTEGRIRMQMSNTSDELTFICKSATSFIQARGVSKKKNLKSGKGPIVITTESTTGGQVFN